MHRNPHAAALAIAAACLGTALVEGCQKSSSTPDAPSTASTSLVSGQAALESFPNAPTEVRAVTPSGQTVEAPLDAKGAFVLDLPPAASWRLELVAQGRAFPLVYPRGETTVEETFSVRHEAAAFELGTVHYVGDAANTRFAVANATADDVPAPACTNGVDATGALCVDNVQASSDTCGPDLDDAQPCEGANCDEPPAVPAPPQNAAVPEHNVPARLGCGDAS